MKLAAVPAAARFASEKAKAELLGFTIQLRVDTTGPKPVAYCRLTARSAKARIACRRAGAPDHPGIEARQEFDEPIQATDACESAILAALSMAKDAVT